MRPLSRSARMGARLAALAVVNTAVYLVYVRAIERAKHSRVRGTLHRGGHLQYDDIVRDSFAHYVRDPKDH